MREVVAFLALIISIFLFWVGTYYFIVSVVDFNIRGVFVSLVLLVFARVLLSLNTNHKGGE